MSAESAEKGIRRSDRILLMNPSDCQAKRTKDASLATSNLRPPPGGLLTGKVLGGSFCDFHASVAQMIKELGHC